MGCFASKETKKLGRAKRKEIANKARIQDFFARVIIPKCILPLDEFVNPSNYTEHDADIMDGFVQLKEWLTNWFQSGEADFFYEIEHMAADGDLVWVHSKCLMTGRTSSTVDIFRLRDNLIIEHWDVTQLVPQDAKNKHPMF